MHKIKFRAHASVMITLALAVAMLLLVSTARVVDAATPPVVSASHVQVGRSSESNKRRVAGQAPCNRHPHLAPTPRGVANFDRDVANGAEVYLVRVRDDTCLQDRGMVSTWEKLLWFFKDRVRIVEIDLAQATDKNALDLAAHLNLSRGHSDLPFVRLYHSRPAGPPPSRTETRKPVANTELNDQCSEGSGETEGCMDSLLVPEEEKERSDAARADASSEAVKGRPVHERHASPQRIEALDRQAQRRQLEADAASSTVSSDPRLAETILHGRGDGHHAIRAAIEKHLKDLRSNSAGFLLKRDLAR